MFSRGARGGGSVAGSTLSALVDIEEHSSVVFQEAAIGMAFVTFEGSFLAVNPAFCDLVQRSEADLLALTWQQITHPDDIPVGEDQVVRMLAGDGEVFRLAKRYLLPDDGVVSALLSVKLMSDGGGKPTCLLTQVVDITDRQRTELGLARLAAIVESSDDAIISTDLWGLVQTWNRAAERIYGFSAAEMVGRSVGVLFPLGLMSEFSEMLERTGRGEAVRNLETVRRRNDGSLVDVSLTASPIFDSNGRLLGISSIARDITGQKATTNSLGRTLDALEDALRDARESEVRSQTFLSNAAHHLRNPVAGVRACLETYLRGAGEEHEEELRIAVVREVARLSQIVNRLLQMERLQRDDAVLLVSRDLVEICRDEVDRASSLAPQLDVSLHADQPLPLDIDPDAISEILRNVLDNARRHARGHIDVLLWPEDGGVTITIADDGPGVPLGAEDDAFQPFVSLDAHGGAGLGLAIARGLARLHGGDLSFKGGAFVLALAGPHREPADSQQNAPGSGV